MEEEKSQKREKLKPMRFMRQNMKVRDKRLKISPA